MDVSQTANEIVISLCGRFNFEAHAEFKALVDGLQDHAPTAVIVDLRGVTEMDSTALGLLLLLRQAVGAHAANIRVAGASDTIRKVLEVANFQRLFLID